MVSGVQRVRPGITVETTERPPAEPKGTGADAGTDDTPSDDVKQEKPDATPTPDDEEPSGAASPAGASAGKAP